MALSGGNNIVLEYRGYLSVLLRDRSDSSWPALVLSVVPLNCGAQKAVVSAASRSSLALMAGNRELHSQALCRLGHGVFMQWVSLWHDFLTEFSKLAW